MFQITVTGNLYDPSGTALVGAPVWFELVNLNGNVPYVSGTNIVIPQKVTVTTTSGGAFTAQIQGNDTITPPSTFYKVTFDNNQVNYYSFTGAGPINLNSFTSLTTLPVPTGSLPTNILTSNNVFTGSNSFGPISVAGALTVTGSIIGSALIASQTFSTTAVPTTKVVDSEPVLNYQGNIDIGSDSGVVVAIRGNATVALGSTLEGGYLYGTEGKITIKGTINTGSKGGVVAGLVGQLDMSAGTHTGGVLAAIWGDWGASAIDASDSNGQVLFLSNTTGDKIEAAISTAVHSSYLMHIDCTHTGDDYNSETATLSVQAGWLKIRLINNAGVAVDRYLPLYSS